MAEHEIGSGSLPDAQVASASCTCGESWVQGYARPAGEQVALRLVRLKATTHLKTLPCSDPEEGVGGDEHDFSEWIDRPAGMEHVRARRLRYCVRCNLYESDPPKQANQ